MVQSKGRGEFSKKRKTEVGWQSEKSYEDEGWVSLRDSLQERERKRESKGTRNEKTEVWLTVEHQVQLMAPNEVRQLQRRSTHWQAGFQSDGWLGRHTHTRARTRRQPRFKHTKTIIDVPCNEEQEHWMAEHCQGFLNTLHGVHSSFSPLVNVGEFSSGLGLTLKKITISPFYLCDLPTSGNKNLIWCRWVGVKIRSLGLSVISILIMHMPSWFNKKSILCPFWTYLSFSSIVKKSVKSSSNAFGESPFLVTVRDKLRQGKKRCASKKRKMYKGDTLNQKNICNKGMILK